MAENKSSILVDLELVKKSKEASHDTSPAKYDKIATSVPLHILVLVVQFNNSIPSKFEQKVSELKHFSDRYARLGTGQAEILLSEGVGKDDSAIVVPFSILSAASQRR